MSKLAVLRALFCAETWRCVHPADILLVGHDADLSVEKGGKKFAPVLDSFGGSLRSCGLTCSRIASPFSRLTGCAAWGEPVHYNRSAALARLLARVGLSREERLIQQILKRSGCRAVVAIDPSSVWARACKTLGVAYVELFHGMGYTSLPARAAGESPDFHVCYDEITAGSLRKNGVPEARIIACKHPWTSHFLETPPEEVVETWPILGDLLHSNGRRRVLVTLQWGYDGEDPQMSGICPDGVMPAELKRAVEFPGKNIDWILRLHPVQTRGERYRHHRELVHSIATRCGHVRAEFQEVPLPALLSSVDAHITLASMACYEAAWLGVPTLAICPNLNEGRPYAAYFEDLVSSRNLIKGAGMGAEEIIQWVSAAPGTKPVELWGEHPDAAARRLKQLIGAS